MPGMGGMVIPGGRVGMTAPFGMDGNFGIEACWAATIFADEAMRVQRSCSVVLPLVAIVAKVMRLPSFSSSPLRPLASGGNHGLPRRVSVWEPLLFGRARKSHGAGRVSGMTKR